MPSTEENLRIRPAAMSRSAFFLDLFNASLAASSMIGLNQEAMSAWFALAALAMVRFCIAVTGIRRSKFISIVGSFLGLAMKLL